MSSYYGSSESGCFSPSPSGRHSSSPSRGYSTSSGTSYASPSSHFCSNGSGQDRLAAEVAARYALSSSRYESSARSATSSSSSPADFPFSPDSIGRSTHPTASRSSSSGYSEAYTSLGYGRAGAADFTPLGAFNSSQPGRGRTTTTSSYTRSSSGNRGSDRLSADAAARYGSSPPSSYFSPDSFDPQSRHTANSRSGGYSEVYANHGYGQSGASFSTPSTAKYLVAAKCEPRIAAPLPGETV